MAVEVVVTGSAQYVGSVRLWELLGLAGPAGVAATGVVLARGERSAGCTPRGDPHPAARAARRAGRRPRAGTAAEPASGRGHRLARVLRRLARVLRRR
jgi:hypothetical protein